MIVSRFRTRGGLSFSCQHCVCVFDLASLVAAGNLHSTNSCSHCTLHLRLMTLISTKATRVCVQSRESFLHRMFQSCNFLSGRYCIHSLLQVCLPFQSQLRYSFEAAGHGSRLTSNDVSSSPAVQPSHVHNTRYKRRVSDIHRK